MNKKNSKKSSTSKPERTLPEPKEMFTVSSVSKDPSRGHRCWSFWDTMEDAIECGVKGWSDGEVFYESGYYDWVVIEKIMRNHPLPITISERVWFRLVPGPTDRDPVSIVKCRCPKRFQRVVGFH